MGNIGIVDLDLTNAEGGLANEPNCTVECFRLDGVTIQRKDHLQFPPKRAFVLPAFPDAQNLHLMITPSLYKSVPSEIFTLTTEKPLGDQIPLQRDPQKWSPLFTLWNQLGTAFDALK